MPLNIIDYGTYHKTVDFKFCNSMNPKVATAAKTYSLAIKRFDNIIIVPSSNNLRIFSLNLEQLHCVIIKNSKVKSVIFTESGNLLYTLSEYSHLQIDTCQRFETLTATKKTYENKRKLIMLEVKRSYSMTN